MNILTRFLSHDTILCVNEGQGVGTLDCWRHLVWTRLGRHMVLVRNRFQNKGKYLDQGAVMF